MAWDKSPHHPLMSSLEQKLVHYKRSRFTTHLPADYLYLPSHAWLRPVGQNQWQVGITKFATRMLGDMVDFGFEVQPDSRVEQGQILGWLEGFKAISDIYGVVDGEFAGANELLKKNITTVNKKPYTDGWLYEATGNTDPRAMDVTSYMALLDKTIDKILEKEQTEDTQ